MTFTNKLKTYLLVGLMSVPGLKASAQNKAVRPLTLEQKMEILGTNDPNSIVNIEDYTTTKWTESTLNTLAAVYSGSAKVEKIGEGYVAVVNFGWIEDQKALKRVLFLADENGDHLITDKEASDLENKLYPIIAEGKDRPMDIEKASLIMGLKENMVEKRYGYFMPKKDTSLLNALAGIYAGTIKIQKIKNGYSVTGNNTTDPKAYLMVLERAGKNKVVTHQSLIEQVTKIYEELQKK